MRNQGLDGKLLVSPPAMVAKSAKRFMSMDVLRKVPEPSQKDEVQSAGVRTSPTAAAEESYFHRLPRRRIVIVAHENARLWGRRESE